MEVLSGRTQRRSVGRAVLPKPLQPANVPRRVGRNDSRRARAGPDQFSVAPLKRRAIVS